MASASPEKVGGTVDGQGRLTAADPPLARLQREAGSDLGHPLAVPQLAFIVRLAKRLGVTISRPALAASADADLDLWVRAEPQDDAVRLVIESWVERPSQRPRWPEEAPHNAGEASSEGGFELDSELRVVSMDAHLADELGTSATKVVGLPLTRVVQLEANEQGDMPLLGALAQRQSFSDQRAVRRSDGANLILTGEVRLSAGGQFTGFIGHARLEQAHQGATPFAASAELDELLRLPIDRIVTEAQQIAQRSEGPLRSDYAAYASDIMAASRHLLDVLHSMSAGAREEKVAEEDGQIDLVALALEAAGLVQAQATEADVSLELEGETSLPSHGDPRAVTQILVNLIGNAVRYSPSGGTVRITASRSQRANICVADEGPGVAPTDRQRIFEPFEQATSKNGGAGLGLAISRRLARSMGGDILLDSLPGHGARFTLSLPLA